MGSSGWQDPTFSADTIAEILEEMREAFQTVTCKRRGLLGHFTAASQLDSLAQVFGEPLSWRLCIPIIPGGSGDPLAPIHCDEQVCEAWAKLGDLAIRGRALIPLRRKAAAAWQHQISQLVLA